jgi:MFS family permease
MALNGPAFLLVAIATPELAIPLLIAAMALESIGGMVYNINQVSFRQAITPTHMQGRMNATMRFIVWGTIPVGSIVGGFLGGAIGLHPTIWVAAVGSFLAFVPLLIGPLKALRVMPEPVGGETVPTVPEAILVGEALDETPEVMGTSPLPRPDTE